MMESLNGMTQTMTNLVKVTIEIADTINKRDQSQEQQRQSLSQPPQTVQQQQSSELQQQSSQSLFGNQAESQFQSEKSYRTTESITPLISQRILEKIKKKEYIKFCLLIQKEDTDSEDSEMEQEEDDFQTYEWPGGSIRCKKRRTKAVGPILTWEEWVECWQEYADNYQEQHSYDPSLPKKMMKHFKVVQDLKKNRKRWSAYDRQFRKMLPRKPERDWDYFDEPLWVKFMTQQSKPTLVNSKKFPKQAGRGKFSQNTIPKGYCYRFHGPARSCNRKDGTCKFNHNCFKCKKGIHSASQCGQNFRARSKFNPNVAGPSSSKQ